MRHHWRLLRPAFTILEVMVVVLVIAILAAVAVPRFVGLDVEARTTAAAATLGAVRASLASHRTNAVIAGTAPYPSLGDLLEPGHVLQQEVPPNPFTKVGGVQSVSRQQAEARAVFNEASHGWNYFVDNDSDPPVAIFYANSAAETAQRDETGRPLGANEL